MNVSSLFALKPKSKETVAPPLAATTKTDSTNPETIQEGETYEHFGIRMCDRVTGDVNCLSPFLQKVFLGEKRRQANNKELQESAKQDIAAQISNTEGVAQRKKCKR